MRFIDTDDRVGIFLQAMRFRASYIWNSEAACRRTNCICAFMARESSSRVSATAILRLGHGNGRLCGSGICVHLRCRGAALNCEGCQSM